MIEIRVERDWSRRDGLKIWVMKWHEGGKTSVMKPTDLEFVEMESDTFLLPQPSIQMGGVMGRELFDAAKVAFADADWINKSELNHHAKVEKAMQAHIDSLKLVVDRTVK